MMNKRWLVSLLILSLFLITLPATSAQQDELKLTINPSNFTLGSEKEAQFIFKLTYNGNPLEEKAISLNATEGNVRPAGGFTNSDGEISFTYTAPSVPEKTQIEITAVTDPFGYSSKTETITGTIKLDPEPFLVVKDLEISKESVNAGEAIEVTSKLLNEGIKGTEQVSLFINNKLEDKKEITIGEDEEKTITFQVFKQKSGNYTVKVGGKTETFLVKQSQIDLKDLHVSPKNASPNEKISISLKVENKMDREINETLDCVVNGVTVDTKQIELTPNQEKTITFTTARTAEGFYNVRVRDLSADFTVNEEQQTPGFTTLIALTALISASSVYYMKRET